MQGEWSGQQLHGFHWLADELIAMKRGDPLYTAVRRALKTRGLWRDARVRSDAKALSDRMRKVMRGFSDTGL